MVNLGVGEVGLKRGAALFDEAQDLGAKPICVRARKLVLIVCDALANVFLAEAVERRYGLAHNAHHSSVFGAHALLNAPATIDEKCWWSTPSSGQLDYPLDAAQVQ
jgi:hypothetical protein